MDSPVAAAAMRNRVDCYVAAESGSQAEAFQPADAVTEAFRQETSRRHLEEAKSGIGREHQQ